MTSSNNLQVKAAVSPRRLCNVVGLASDASGTFLLHSDTSTASTDPDAPEDLYAVSTSADDALIYPVAVPASCLYLELQHLQASGSSDTALVATAFGGYNLSSQDLGGPLAQGLEDISASGLSTVSRLWTPLPTQPYGSTFSLAFDSTSIVDSAQFDASAPRYVWTKGADIVLVAVSTAASNTGILVGRFLS